MSRGRIRLIAVALAAFAMVASSCFVMRVVQLTEKSLGPGEQTRYKVSLYRVDDDNDGTAYTFLLIGLKDLDLANFAKFDQKANFGGPFNSIGDTSLRDELTQNTSFCSAGGASAKEIFDNAGMESWHAYRTTVKVNSATGGFNARNLVKFLVTRQAGTSNTGHGEIVIFSGWWTDPTNDLVASSSIEIGCTSVYFSNVAFTS